MEASEDDEAARAIFTKRAPKLHASLVSLAVEDLPAIARQDLAAAVRGGKARA
jgi:hypothetical protein